MMYQYAPGGLQGGIKDGIRFAVRHVGKIYPLHVMMLIASLPFAIYMCLLIPSTKQIIVMVIALICDCLLIQAWVPIERIYFSLNSVSWYLSVYLFVCFCFPAILKRLRNKGSRAAFINIICIFAIQILIGMGAELLLLPKRDGEVMVKWVTYILPLFRFGDFYIGCNLYEIFQCNLTKDNKVVNNLLEIVAVLMFVFAYIACTSKAEMFGNSFLKGTILCEPASMILVYSFARNKGWISKMLSNRVLIGIGNLSAYAFLIHQIIIRYLSSFGRKIIKADLNIYIQVLIAFFITIFLSIAYRKFLVGNDR